MSAPEESTRWPLPSGITQAFLSLPSRNLKVHYLSTASSQNGRKLPLILCLHGFPELSYSWRKIMLPLAEMGYRVVATDQRGYGQTSGGSNTYISDQAVKEEFNMINVVADVQAFVTELGYSEIHLLIGHDFGSRLAGFVASAYPDLVKRLITSSSPYAGPPSASSTPFADLDLHNDLAQLDPPRKHYQMYYATEPANGDMMASDLTTFFIQYLYGKSANNRSNVISTLPSSTASSYALLPHYYVMPLQSTMPESVSPYPSTIDSLPWLTEEELEVYVSTYQRTTFQGGLNYYRAGCLGGDNGRLPYQKIDCPWYFLAPKSDWGPRQIPGQWEAQLEHGCRKVVEVDGAGHWVQQENPDMVVKAVREILQER